MEPNPDNYVSSSDFWKSNHASVEKHMHKTGCCAAMEKRSSTLYGFIVILSMLLFAWHAEASGAARGENENDQGRRSSAAGSISAAGAPPSRRAPNMEEGRYREAWELVRDHYLYPEKLSNWHEWEHKFDGSLKKKGDAARAIAQMLDSLDDDFTYLHRPQGTEVDRGRSLSWRWLSSDVGYIRIHHFFSKDLLGRTDSALRKLSRAKALIVDLRDNPGGKIDTACRASSYFINQGTLATLRGREGNSPHKEEWVLAGKKLLLKENERVRASEGQPDQIYRKPLFVLVNSETRSAAELFAGDLRDLSFATILGTRTFGKGVAQDVYEFGDGSLLKIVTASIHLPSGECVHGVGLKPDHQIDLKDEAAQLQAAVKFAERDARLIAASERKQI